MKKFLIIGLILLLFLPVISQAAFVNCGGAKQSECTIAGLFITIRTIVNFLLSWAWMVCILFIVWAGWSMVTAGGNEESISAAKTTLNNAIMGFFMIMAAFVLLNWVVAVLTGSQSDLKDIFKLIP